MSIYPNIEIQQPLEATKIEDHSLLKDLNVCELSVIMNLTTGKISGTDKENYSKSDDRLLTEINTLYPEKRESIAKLISNRFTPATQYFTNLHPGIEIRKNAIARTEMLTSLLKQNSAIMFCRAMEKPKFDFINLLYDHWDTIDDLNITGIEPVAYPFISVRDRSTRYSYDPKNNYSYHRDFMRSLSDRINEISVARKFLYMSSSLNQGRTNHSIRYPFDTLPVDMVINIINSLDRIRTGSRDRFEILEDKILESDTNLGNYMNSLEARKDSGIPPLVSQYQFMVTLNDNLEFFSPITHSLDELYLLNGEISSLKKKISINRANISKISKHKE